MMVGRVNAGACRGGLGRGDDGGYFGSGGVLVGEAVRVAEGDASGGNKRGRGEMLF